MAQRLRTAPAEDSAVVLSIHMVSHDQPSLQFYGGASNIICKYMHACKPLRVVNKLISKNFGKEKAINIPRLLEILVLCLM